MIALVGKSREKKGKKRKGRILREKVASDRVRSRTAHDDDAASGRPP